MSGVLPQNLQFAEQVISHAVSAVWGTESLSRPMPGRQGRQYFPLAINWKPSRHPRQSWRVAPQKLQPLPQMTSQNVGPRRGEISAARPLPAWQTTHEPTVLVITSRNPASHRLQLVVSSALQLKQFGVEPVQVAATTGCSTTIASNTKISIFILLSRFNYKSCLPKFKY